MLPPDDNLIQFNIIFCVRFSSLLTFLCLVSFIKSDNKSECETKDTSHAIRIAIDNYCII